MGAAAGIGLVGAALVLATVRGGVRIAGALLLGLGLVTVSWNAVRIGPFQPGDLFLLGAAVLLFFEGLRHRRAPWLPALMLTGAALIAASCLLTALGPPSPSYLSGRVLFVNPYVQYGLHTLTSGNNLVQGAQFLIALVLLPVVVQLLQPTSHEVRWLAAMWAMSALLSAIVAIGDATGISHVSRDLLGYVVGGGRYAGLSIQPNHLAVALILVTPVVLSWVASTSKAMRVVSVPAMLVLFGGVLLTGSRGGLVGMLLAAGLTIVLVPELRPPPRVLAVVLPVLGLVALGVGASVLADIATQSRLAAGLGDLSDAQRSVLQSQAIADFSLSPLHGIGFDHIDEAHQVFLQLLAAGGVIGLAGYGLYWIGVLRAGVFARRFEPALASVLLVSAVSFLAISLVENQVTDRYLYVPAALIVGLAAVRRREGAARRTSRRAVASWSPLSARRQPGGTMH
ncbi:MAG: O-antigen ligase family protein [Candidatus Dormibacteraeota bacterium]|nr:O-antigen ligase family protein [Candidatus Dormibacteraeota bacterium]